MKLVIGGNYYKKENNQGLFFAFCTKIGGEINFVLGFCFYMKKPMFIKTSYHEHDYFQT